MSEAHEHSDLGTALLQMTFAALGFDQIVGALNSQIPGFDWKKILATGTCLSPVDISQTGSKRSYWLNPSVLAVRLRGMREFEVADRIELAYSAALISSRA